MDDSIDQQNNVDCSDTLSSVIKPAIIRTILSITLSKSWSLHQLDIKNAFLHEHLS